MAAEQGLVGGDDVLAGGEGGLVDLGGGVLAADELDHDVNGRVGDDVVPVGGEGLIGDAAGAGSLNLERATAGDGKVDAVVGDVVVVVGDDGLCHAATNGAKADDADVHGAHVVSFSCRRPPACEASVQWCRL